MRIPCVICEQRKARRDCLRHDHQLICSLCCAEIRNDSCEGCRHYAQAKAYQTSKAVASGIPDGHWIIELDPEVEEAVDAALALGERDRVDRAWDAMTELAREHPRNHIVCYGMGVVHLMKEEFQDAIDWFERAVEIFPLFLEAHHNLAIGYSEQLDVGRAIRAYQKVVEYGEGDDEVVGHAQSCIDGFSASVLESDGVDLETYLASLDQFNAASLAMEDERWQEALDGFIATAAINDRNAPTHGNMGLCYARLGQKAKALTALDRALEIDPGYELALGNRIGIERMTEGSPLDLPGTTINYAAAKLKAENKGRKKKRFWQRG